MTNTENNQVTLAVMMGLSFAQTVVFPSAITSCAKAVNMTESKFMEQMALNPALREYVAGICVKVAGENPELVAI